MFFNFYLPPIIFNSGYSMRRKRFFQNLGNIMIFGLVVTIFCFVLYSFGTWAILKYMQPTMTNYYCESLSAAEPGTGDVCGKIWCSL